MLHWSGKSIVNINFWSHMCATVSLFQTDIYQTAEGRSDVAKRKLEDTEGSWKSIADLKAVLMQSPLMCWLWLYLVLGGNEENSKTVLQVEEWIDNVQPLKMSDEWRVLGTKKGLKPVFLNWWFATVKLFWLGHSFVGSSPLFFFQGFWKIYIDREHVGHSFGRTHNLIQ